MEVYQRGMKQSVFVEGIETGNGEDHAGGRLVDAVIDRMQT